MIKDHYKGLLTTLGFVLLGGVVFLIFNAGKQMTLSNIEKRSACIANELKTEFISSDLQKCLCEEGGNDVYVIQTDSGEWANVCVLKGTK